MELTAYDKALLAGEHGEAAQLAMRLLVKTGKVRLKPSIGDNHIDLEANEKGIFEKNEKDLLKRKDDLQNDLAWHTKTLNFSNTPLHQVLRIVGAFYNAEIDLEQADLRRCSFSNTFKKQEFVPPPSVNKNP